MTDILLKALKDNYGYTAFRPLQREIIETIINKQDVFALMPTGGGKSLLYQIPSIVMDGVGVVISPLISLMQNQVDHLKQLDVKAEFLNSSLTSERIEQIEYDLVSGKIDLLYISPERLTKASTITFLKKLNIALFAIDEAHCISQQGHSFREEYMKLSIIPEHFPDVPLLAITATADGPVRNDIIRTLKLQDAKLFVSSFDRPNIHYRIQIKKKDSEKDQVLKFIKIKHRQGSGIVYCLSRKATEEMNQYLQDNGINSMAYHAGFSNKEREEIQNKWIDGKVAVIVCTLASFGMGIDAPYVDFVINVGLPKSIEEYYQSSGRGGRAGQSASSLLLYSLSDTRMLRKWIDESNAPAAQKRIEHHKLDSMLNLAEQFSCRRVTLLKYFGETPKFKNCGNCDNCQS